MARETREIWTKRVERWRDSGLRSTEFAAESGINARTLTYWAWRLRTDGNAKPATKRREARATAAPEREARATAAPERVAWVEVAAPAPPSVTPVASAPLAMLEVVCGRATVRVPADFDATALGRLLDVLEAR